MEAILLTEELQMKFPTSQQEIENAANEFKIKSYKGVIDGCIGALDGLLVEIQAPSANETGNVASYYSGHYQCHGINVQGCVDAHCRFIFLSPASPGGSNDIIALKKSGFLDLLNHLPAKKYIVSDCAYICSEHILTPFAGDMRRESATNDAYNYYISHLRQTVERAFGLMVQKWIILKSPLQIKLKNVTKLIMCIGLLHNYCIDDRWDYSMVNSGVESQNTIEDNDELQYRPSTVKVTDIVGVSMMRNLLVRKILRFGLVRPSRIPKITTNKKNN